MTPLPSRDVKTWTRFPRPTYIGNGRDAGQDIHMAYIAQGMVRRGEEIWQYYLGKSAYHSAWGDRGRSHLYPLVQRLDGFVALEAAYSGGHFLSKPFTFEGNQLVLNMDPDATGYAQVGLTEASGEPIEGFSAEDCIYINGDHINQPIEWLKRGTDVASLTGRPVRLEIRMRGAKLYAFQFEKKN